MNKNEILIELHAIIATRLLGAGPWLMDRETAVMSKERASEMGLEKQVTRDTWRLTSLGEEIDFDLLSIFMGRQDESDIPIILEQRGLIKKTEADSIFEQWANCADPELAMKSYVRKAYLRCFRPPKFRR